MTATDQYIGFSGLDDDVLASRDPATNAVVAAVRRLAPRTTPVLLLGEPGSGRGLLARRLHEFGAAPDSPFVELDCSGLESLHFVANAGRGTVFLRDIEALAPRLQDALAGLLAGPPSALRMVASGGPSAADGCSDGRLSQRLVAAFGESCLRLPALRERAADVPDLVGRLIDRKGRALRVGESAMGYLVEYDWPGNVGELAQVVDRLCTCASGAVASADDLPPQIRWFPGRGAGSLDAGAAAARFNPLGEEFQLQLIADALRRTHRR